MRLLHGLLLLICVSAAAFALCLVPSSALGQDSSPRQRAKEHTEQGAKFQKLGDFEKAIAEYQAAYDLVPHPQLLYNLAQAYRLHGDKEKALKNYEIFVSIDTESAAANKAKDFIVLLREAIAEQAKNAPITSVPIPEPRANEPVALAPGNSAAPEEPTDPIAARDQPVMVDRNTDLFPAKPSFMDTPGVRVGAAWSFVQHDFGDGVGPSFQVGYEFLWGRIGVRPGARLDYFLLDDDDGDNSLVHAGADVRVGRSMRGRIMPFLGLGIGLSRFTHVSDSDEEDNTVLDLGLHVDAGIEVLVYDRYALGAMFIADLSASVENTVAGGGFTLTRY